MINQNIKHFRKAKGLSQEEMAVKLNVVRQTVSKWENGLSVPDAQMLIQMAEILEVSVNQLLGIKANTPDLSREFAQLKQALEKKKQDEKLLQQANQKRGLILTLSIAAILIALVIKNETMAIIGIGACILAAAMVLYRHLDLLTRLTTDDVKIGVLRLTTIFDILIFAVVTIFALLSTLNSITFSENDEKILAMVIVFSVIFFSGIICPRLPFSKHTGLRLPWTVQDEETWNIAHRILGYIALPLALLYVACSLTIANFEAVTLAAMIAWIGIPGVVSFVFYAKKCSGK